MVNIFEQEVEEAEELLVPPPSPIDQVPDNETMVSHFCTFSNVMAFDHT